MDKDKKITHSDLVSKAIIWLKKKHPLIVSEMCGGAGEQPDAIGFLTYGSTLIECKVSRQDFLRDKKKPFRKYPEHGVGMYRYYMCPTGLIKEEELPDKWGLIYVNEKLKTRVIVNAVHQEWDAKSENAIMLSLIRRIGQHPINGVSIKCYSHETKNNATTSIEPLEVNP